MENKTIQSLEFLKILDKLSKYAASSLGKASILSLSPSFDLTSINRSLDEIQEAFLVSEKCSKGLSFSFDDITEILSKARVFSTLGNSELLKLSKFIKIASRVKDDINSIKSDDIYILKDYVKTIVLPIELANFIDENILSDTEISDNASPFLKGIRKKIKNVSEQIKRKLDFYVNSKNYTKFLQDAIVTIRNDRYVIPVKAEYKNSITGLIHNQSSSGQTLFIEPIAIVEMNNELKTFIIQENIEIERILKDLTIQISANVDKLLSASESLTSLDVIFAKSYFAYSTNSVKPMINTIGLIDIELGRHPLLNKDTVVPTSIHLGKNFSVMLITGPNTGGKTVVLKLVGILELMAMTGLYVPAKRANLSIFDNVFCDIGDEQSIEQSLSTFSGHINNIKYITENMTNFSLVLLDELGAGTDPTEGASLAISILEFIIKTEVKAIITTHFNEMKEYAFIHNNVENASMDFNPNNYQPTYNLIIGTPGQSNAIEIAAKIGLNQVIIEKARSSLKKEDKPIKEMINALEKSLRESRINEDKSKKILFEIEEKKKQLDKEIEKIRVKKEKIEENVTVETNKRIREAINEADSLIKKIKELSNSKSASDADLFEARAIKRTIERLEESTNDNSVSEYPELTDKTLSVGCTVKILPLNIIGTIISIDGKKNSVQVITGNIKSIFKKEQVIPVYSPLINSKPNLKKSNLSLNNKPFSPNIKIVGFTVTEALPELEIFLNNAYQSSITSVRIIHGIGTGRLREGVRKYLNSHCLVKEAKDGEFNEGGRGVTVVTLNK